MFKKYIFNFLIIFIIFFYMSCTFYQNLHCNLKELMYTKDHHQQLISQIFCYQIFGNIIYMINTQKIFGRFVWIQHNKNCYNIKFFDIFGFTLASIYVENGIISVSSNIIRQNNNFGYEIKKWFITNGCSLDQLQQWIIGSPGYNTEYNLNSIGCLSYLHYHCINENIFIHYRSYYTNSIPILPKVIEIYYGKHYIRLTINRWDIK